MPCSRKAIIATPPRRLARFGLLATANIETVPVGSPELGGIRLTPESCEPPKILQWACNAEYNKAPSCRPDEIQGCSFALMGSDLCHAQGPASLDGSNEGRRRAELHLKGRESWGLERAWSTGKDCDGNDLHGLDEECTCRWLHDGEAKVIGTEPCDVAGAIAAIENGLTDCTSGLGTIHIPYIAAEYLLKCHLIERTSANTLETILGNKVVLGSGYTGADPDGAPADPGTAWIYGTGDVYGVRAAETLYNVNAITKGLNTDNNQVVHRVEREYALLADGCCIVAAQMNLC